MSADGDNTVMLREIVRRHVWLLSELHGGDEFSKDLLWRWLREAEAAIAKTKGAP